MKILLAILIPLLLPFVLLVSPLIFIYSIVDRHYEYLEKKKGFQSKQKKSVRSFSVNDWAKKLNSIK
jgi:hypothetical protein